MHTKKSIFVSFLLLASVSFGGDGSPEQQIVGLMDQLKAGKNATAFQDFFADTLMVARKPMEVRMMDSQSRSVWEIMGVPLEYEIVRREEIGKKMFRLRWITWHKDEVPMFWSATFLKRNEKWEPFGVLFFDDLAKAGF